jgi:hypothetical protein
MSTEPAPEQEQTLVTLVAPLVVWTAHFLFAYALAAIVCAKGLPLLVMRLGVAVATALALAIVVRLGARGLARFRTGAPEHDAPTALSRRGFLGFVSALVAGLAGVSIVYSAAVFVFIRDCR